jgi:hypothetical protein
MAVVVWALMAVALGELVWRGSAGEVARWAPSMAAVSYAVWLVFWYPRVVVSRAEVLVRNITASFAVPLAAVERIDTKYALTLHTRGCKVTAFAAPAPSSLGVLRQAGGAKELRHLPESTFDAGNSIRPGDLPSTASGALAWVIRERWESVRDAGFPPDPPPVQVTRHWAQLAALVALPVAAFLATRL